MYLRDLMSRVGTLLIFFVLLSPFQIALSAEYDIIDLGEGTAVAVNDTGHVISNRNSIAYFYDGNSVISIGELSTGTVIGCDLNNHDEVVGTYRPTGVLSDTSVAYYDGASWTVIGKFGAEIASASGINDNSIIAGTYKPSGSDNKAFIYNVATTTLKDLPSYSDAASINANAWIAGTDKNISGYERAYYSDGTTVSEIDPIGGVLGVMRGYGKDLNDLGDVVGKSHDALYHYHAFLYDGTAVTDLGTLVGSTGEARAINNGGIIVGNSLDGDGQQRALFMMVA